MTNEDRTRIRLSVLAIATLSLVLSFPARAQPDGPTGVEGSASLVGIDGRYLSEDDIGHLFNTDVGGSGVLVERVRDGSPAARAGLIGGDVPAEIGGQSILLGGDLILQLEIHVVCHDDCLKEAPAELRRIRWIGVTYLRAGRIRTAVIDLRADGAASPSE